MGADVCQQLIKIIAQLPLMDMGTHSHTHAHTFAQFFHQS